MAGKADGLPAALGEFRDRALDWLGQTDTALDGRLWLLAAGACLLLMVLAFPQRRSAPAAVPWPRLWACGAVGGLAAAVVLIVR